MHKYGLIILLLAFLVAGCSGGSSPVTPGQGSSSLDSVPVIDLSQSGDMFNAIGLMGAYEIVLNPDEMTADLVSKRSSAVGEGYIVSGISFFTMVPCSNCLTLSGFALEGMNVAALTFSIQHPFAPGNPANPPTAANRLDLDVFDVAMVIAPQTGTAEAYPLTGASIYNTMCVDADGYTRELQNVISDNAALPYFLVKDDSLSGTSTWNKLGMGATADFNVKFALVGPLKFDMYLTMGYGASARKMQRLTPKYFNPEFNRTAAWKVAVVPPGPAEMGSTWQDNDSTTEYDVEVHVWDWQQGATVYSDPADFENAPTNNIFSASDVASVSVEIPGMIDALATSTTPASGDGSPADPLVFMVPVANENLLAMGQYVGLVKVTDDRAAGVWDVDGRDFIIDTPDGVALNNYNMPEYATYQVFTADVVLGCGPVTGDILSPSCPITGVANNATINFTVIASSDNGGDPVVLYEVDYDYDGVTFNASDSNTTGVFAGVGPFTVPDPCDDNVPADFTVAFRATDSCDPANETIFATCEVTVETCLETVGQVTIVVNRLPLANRYSINTTTPWTLSWDDASGAVEYAIYRDNNPADGLDNNFTLIGTTASTSFDVPSSEYPSNRYVIGNTYSVRSRAVAGDPSSEAADSQLAFITVSGFDTGTANTSVHNSEGWFRQVEGTGNNNWYYSGPRHQYSATQTPEGTMDAKFTPFVGPSYPTYGGRWQGLMKETPDVPGATVRRMESAMWFQQIAGSSGQIYGTSATLPDQYNWTNTSIVNWVQTDSTAPFRGYNFVSSDVASRYSDVPSSGNNAWNSSGLANGFYLVGANVNNLDDSYVCFQHVNLFSGTQNYTAFDSVSIVIY